MVALVTSKIQETIIATFPDMVSLWNGGSKKHLSRGVVFLLPSSLIRELGKFSPEETIAYLAKTNFHSVVINGIKELPLGDVEWLIPEREFSKMIYHLLYLSLNWKQPSFDKYLKNPQTGNVFVPLLVKQNVIVGFRCWCGTYDTRGAAYTLGYRLRFEVLQGSDHETTERNRAKNAVAEMEEVKESSPIMSAVEEYLEIQEPQAVKEKEKPQILFMVESEFLH